MPKAQLMKVREREHEERKRNAQDRAIIQKVQTDIVNDPEYHKNKSAIK